MCWCFSIFLVSMSLMQNAEGNFLEDTLVMEHAPQEFFTKVSSLYMGVRSLVLLDKDTYHDPTVVRLIGNHPHYSVQVTEDQSAVMQFNGRFNYEFDDEITFEESKLYILRLHDRQSALSALQTMERIYFFRKRDHAVIIMSDEIDYLKVVDSVKDAEMHNVIFIYPANGSVFTFDKLEGLDWFELSDDYFYDKLTNFHGSTIRISMFRHVRDAIPCVARGDYNGRDGQMSRTLMNMLNATGAYVPPSDGITYGENHGRKNITGVFGDVARNFTTIAMNSRLLKPEFENVVEYSYPHGRDDLVILVPCGNADVTIEYHKSFDAPVWASIIVFNFFCCAVFVKTRIFDRTSTAALYTFGIFFGQSYSTSKTVLGRVLVLLYTFYSFLILVHYSSLLMSIITVPHKPLEINTFEELAESGLKMYTVERYKRYLTTYGEESVKRLKDRIYIRSEIEVTDLIEAHGDYAVICKRSVADYAVLNRKNYRNGRMMHRIMNKSPFPAIICYIVKYGSPLKLSLNVYVNRIVESGIQDYWMDNALNEIFCRENKHYAETFDPFRKIALDELIPIFSIYLVGIVCSIFAFTGEVLGKHYNWKPSLAFSNLISKCK